GQPSQVGGVDGDGGRKYALRVEMTGVLKLRAVATVLAAAVFAFSAQAWASARAGLGARPDGRWTVSSSDSVAGYRARERYVGVTIPTEVVGRTSVIQGSMEIVDETIASTLVTVDMRTLRSDKPQRDDNLNTRMGPKWNLYPR